MTNKKTISTVKGISTYPRPIPYFNTGSTRYEKELAAALRREFVPKISRRLPSHHLHGFPHNFIVKFVATQKKNYPWFLRTDIEKFYPSIEHRELLINLQLAYRELLSLPYVPDIYTYLENELNENYKLRMNLSKTYTGRFASNTVDFCGWEFSGGYARISYFK